VQVGVQWGPRADQIAVQVDAHGAGGCGCGCTHIKFAEPSWLWVCRPASENVCLSIAAGGKNASFAELKDLTIIPAAPAVNDLLREPARGYNCRCFSVSPCY
jgi:hypothetical protein